ncbi:MAG: helix-turn-helix transcriptional regulator [Rhodothermales bacterium]
MPHEIDTARLAAAIRDRRKDQNLGVRAASSEIGGVSSSTLSRVEKGNLPDLDTYLRLCRWLGRPATYFARDPGGVAAQETRLPDDVIVQLRADRTLDERTRDALVTMIRTAYAAAKRGDIEDESVYE